MKQTPTLSWLVIFLLNLLIFQGLIYGDVPTVTIDSGPDNIDHTDGTADFTGNVTDDGSLTVTTRGMCWALTHDPTIDANNHTGNGSGTGTFDATITEVITGEG